MLWGHARDHRPALHRARLRVARTDPRLKACTESLEVRRSDSLSDSLSDREAIQLLKSCLTDVTRSQLIRFGVTFTVGDPPTYKTVR